MGQTISDNFTAVFEREKEVLENRAMSTEEFKCPLCDMEFYDAEALIGHVRTKGHKDNLSEFLET